MVLLALLHVGQTAFSAYGLYVSYIAITNLRKYEAKSEKAAEYSEQAAHELHKTRTTQASGAITIIACLIVSFVLATTGSKLPAYVRFGASPAMITAVLAARAHMSNYWSPGDGMTIGTRVPLPGLQGYNEAQRKTEELLQILQWLEYSWVGTAMVAGIVGYDKL